VKEQAMNSDASRARLIAIYSLGMGVAGWSLLLFVTRWDTLRANLWPLLAFTGLSLVIKRLGFHVTRDVTHSLVGIVDLAAVFALGPIVGAWVAALSGFAYLELRAVHRHLFSWRLMGEHPLFSSGLKALMALGCGQLYIRLGGAIAPVTVTWRMFVPLLATLILWFAIDHAAWGGRVVLRDGPSGLRDFLRGTLASSILIDLLPLPLSIVIALAYVGMGQPAFVLLALALVASGALLRRLSQVWTRLEKRVAELGVLSDFGRALVEAQLDVNQLCELLYEYCRKVVDAPIFVLELVHAERNQVGVVIHVERGQRQPRRTLPTTETMRWMASKREPLLSTNIGRDGLPFEPHLIGELPQSLLMVPLLAGPQLIGALSVQSDETHAFDQDELNVLCAIANQAAMAIVNARVYEAEQRRAKQLAAISQVGQQVAAILELDALFAYVVELVQETFHYDHVGIFTVDVDSGEVTFRASTSPVIQEQGLVVPVGEGIIGSVAQSGEPVLANDVTKELRYRLADVLVDTQAELAVPLKVEERIVGVLDVQSNASDAFGQDDLFVLQTLADQVAIAVEGARLYAARQEEAWSSTALLQVAEAVRSLDNLDEILETVVRITPMLVGVDRCSILLWDDEAEEFVSAQGYTLGPEMRPLFDSMHFRPGDIPLLDQLRAHQKPILVETAAEMQAIPPDLAEDFQIGSLLALPLGAQADLYGAMLVDYADPQARFSDRKQTILSGIANQAAMAIANAWLHTAQREEAWVSTALLQVAQTLASSTDLVESITKIARLTPLLVGVDRCMIFLWEGQQGEFVPYAAHGLSKEIAEALHGLRLKPDEMPLLDEMIRQQTYVVIENAPDSDLIPAELLRTFDIKSLLAMPLRSKGETVGALLVDYTQGPRRFSRRNIHIVEGIAHQTALAIENARLYEATLEQERTAQELRLAREIQVSFLPEQCPSLPGWEICADWIAARGVGGDFYDFIPLDAEHLGLVIADVSDKGMPAALFMSLSSMLVRVSAAELRSPARALQRVNELIMTETRSDMFLTLFYGVLNWQTGLLTYANAGHNPPILWQHPVRAAQRAGHGPAHAMAGHGPAEQMAGHGTESQVTALTAKGTILGVIEDIALEERQITVEPGDMLVLYTDGVTEPINEKEEEFGEERLVQVIASNQDKPCSEIVELIHAAVSNFAGDQPQFDDYTLVGLKHKS
jgi:sigma-B regulation protein RsbU (phosphoserine phosphatase)